MNNTHKILFNCTTNVVGGGAKNAFLFILSALKENEIEWTFAISEAVKELLVMRGVMLDERFHVFEMSPAKSVAARQRLYRLCIEQNCELVYTMAGPAYVRFPIRHVQGLSNAFYTHADFDAFLLQSSLWLAFKQFLRAVYQYWNSRYADFFLFQTEFARRSYVKRGGAKYSQTKVISNAFDAEMKVHFQLQSNKRSFHRVPVIFCPGANYVHKAFQFIPKIAKALEELGITVQFVLTLKDGSLWKGIQMEASELGIDNCIKNIGPFGYDEIIGLYDNSDIVYVPSLLETFSASYLEAMAAQKPLVVSTKQFARDVCGDYAFYANPKDPIESANAIARIVNGFRPNQSIAENILAKYGNQQERFRKIVRTLIAQASK